MDDEIKLLFHISGPDLPMDEVIVGRQGLRVGRSADNTLQLNNREISRQHMRIFWEDDNLYYVEDLNSSNGVWLNDQRLTPREPALIEVSDTIRLGPFVLKFERIILPVEDSENVFEEEIAQYESLSRSLVSLNGHSPDYPPGIPRDRSTWLEFMPAIYSDDEFMGRYLLIFESILNPIIWNIDNFDLYLSPETAPPEWLRWICEWFDLLLLPELPETRQRAIVRQIGWLFMRRGTRAGLERLLELYFGVSAEIIEPQDEICHFVVRLPLSESDTNLDKAVADRLIASQKPAFTTYKLEVN